MRLSSLLAASIFFLIGCGTGPSEGDAYEPEGLSRRDAMRFQQYYVQGKLLYATYCSNCHQRDGTGLAKLYPPLANSDYLMADVSRAACIVRNGQEGSIEVNGIEYNLKMTGLAELKPLEIAEILTYVTNSWGNEGEFV